MNRKKRQQELLKKAYGSEPKWHDIVFESDEQRADEMWRARSWYRQNATHRDKKKWVCDYAKTILGADAAKPINAVSSKLFNDSVALLCRMKAQGLELTDQEVDLINEELRQLKDKGSEKLESQRPKKSIQERIEEQVSDYCGQMCEVTDTILSQILTRKSVTFNMTNWLTNNKVKSLQSRKIADYLRPTLEEILEAIEGKDPQLVEGYSYMTKPMIKKWARILSAIITACEEHAAQGSKRKPRKKKVKTAAQQVSKVKYQDESTEYKLKSIDPSKIIGATTLLVFNTKYRQLTVYRSSDVTGFSVKGTTLQNFDPSKSETKTVRKPDQLSTIQGIRSFNNFWKDIKTKGKVPTGRINDNTIIMKAYE